MRSTYFWKLSLLFLTGCAVKPQYEPPQMDIPNEWHTSLSEGMSLANPDCFLWWESLNDPILNSLIKRASQQNLDLFIAGTRILQARLERRGKEAEIYPHVNGSVTAGHLYWSKDVLVDGIRKAIGSPHPKHSCKRNVSFFEVGFDADWEIDLFGFHQYDVRAAQARLESVEESFCDIWVTLTAEIARNYIELRGLQQRRHLVIKITQSLEESKDLIQELLTIGMASQVDLLKMEEQLSLMIAQKPLLDLAIERAIHRLSILLGSAPGELFAELCEPQELPSLPFEKPVGIPSDLLRRRPDIRRAERNLAAATEAVGSAIGELFPRFSLYGFVGEVNTRLKSLTNGRGITWFAAPQLLFPIFNSRLITQDVQMNKIQAQQALFEYQKTVLAALEEVENAMAALRYEMERNEQFNRAQTIDREAYELTLQLHQKGVSDYLEVLAAHRVLLLVEEKYLQNQIDLILHYISLYKALGGGWDVSQCET